MLLRPLKSTMIIVFFITLNSLVWWGAWSHRGKEGWGQDSEAILSDVPTEMQELEYFHLENGNPSLSLVADSMRSVGEDLANFSRPRGTYAPDAKKSAISYQAQSAEFVKARDSLKLLGDVRLDHEASTYEAAQVTYYLKKDVLYGKGGVKLVHHLAKSGQRVDVKALSMKARPKQEWAELTGQVDSIITPKQRFQDPLYLKSQLMELQGVKGQIALKNEVSFKRGEMLITARNGDVFLEQANKKLKYFILNDDVKVTENLLDAQGKPMVRKAFAERLEGFGQDKVVLSGAPRVLQGKDAIKGYRITLREKMEFIEVEDAMSDVQVQKKNEDKNAKERE